MVLLFLKLLSGDRNFCQVVIYHAYSLGHTCGVYVY